MEGKSVLDRREQALDDDVGQNVGADIRDRIAQRAGAFRHHIKADQSGQERHDHAENHERLVDGPRRRAGGMDDYQLAVGVDPIQRIDAGDEQRDRTDHHDQCR